jgi:hypothetical protein
MNPEDLVDFSNWLSERARSGGRLGIAIVEKAPGRYEIALSDGRSWQVGNCAVGEDGEQDALCEVIEMHLRSRNGIEFIARDIPTAVKQLSYITQLDPKELAGRFVGDLASMTYTTGIEYPLQSPAAAEATTALVMWNSVEGQKPPAYLNSIAIPWQRLLSHSESVIPASRWRVSYPELLTRVIAHYSHESMLIRECQSNNVLSRLMEALQPLAPPNEENPEAPATHEFAYQCLLFTALGYDKEFYAARFGEPPIVVNEALDSIIPTVRAMAMMEYQDACQQGYAKTLYGRRMRIERQSIAEVMWFILGGSVQDILTVAQVTFANNGGFVEPSVWRSDAEHIRIRGTISKREEPDFLQLLAQLAPLTAPLVPIPLSPTVVLE